jgi:hypothetical protein
MPEHLSVEGWRKKEAQDLRLPAIATEVSLREGLGVSPK